MKAFVLSILTSLVFLIFIGLLFHSDEREHRRIQYIPPQSVADCPKVNTVTEPVDPNEKFRFIEGRWSHIDFKTRSYGEYKFSSGERLDLTVYNGEFEYDFGPDKERGWFFIKDTFFTDVTGDGKDDAIVWFAHVECGASCNGGSSLFYVYSLRGEGLKEIWRYETGTYGFGCGLKSLTVLNKQLVVKMFGRCSQPEKGTGENKYTATGATIANFYFNGARFVKKETEFVSGPEVMVNNYDAKINIVE